MGGLASGHVVGVRSKRQGAVMADVTRRASFGLLGAAFTAAMAGKALAGETTGGDTAALKGTGEDMTLAEFRELNGPGSVAELFTHMRGEKKTFDMCHRKLRDEQGIWIPELVPVFRDLDAKAAGPKPA